MTLQDKVSTIMSKKLITLHPKDKLKRAKEIFEEYKIRHIPVVVMNEIAGILSKGDILYLEGIVRNGFDKFIQESMLNTMTIDQVMTAQVKCAHIDQSIGEVVDIMIDHKINAMPILEKDLLVGLVTTFDIMKSLQKTKS